MSNIVLNIVEPTSPTPVDPGTGTVVPDTGLFTSGIGGAEAAIIATVALVVILAIIGAFIYYKKKQGKTPSFFAHFKHTKSTTGLAALALMVSIATVAGLVKLTTSAIEGDELEAANADNSSLTVDVSSTEFTIELADEPVFAVLPVDITVEEATTLGYTLTAYTDSTNLVSTTDSSNIIPMVTVDTTDIEEADEAEELRSLESDAAESSDSSTLVPLSPNTYGLSLVDPESALDEVFTSLSTDSTTPTFITDKDYLATEANDTTTIYYGFYITPDTPYGTYTGSNISVDAIPNLATITYDAHGLYYDNDESFTTNTVGYKPVVAEAPIEEVVGEYLTPAPLTPVDPSTTIHYTFLGWSETEGATTPTYTNEEDILANLTLTKNESLTLYAVWHYNTVLSFNGTTSDGGSSIPDQTIAAGTTITLPHNTYTRTGSVFTGWNTVETPTPDNPGKSYADEATFTAPNESADITLYAQWAYTTTITFNGNGATSGSMSPQTVVAGTPENLTKNTFVRTNATFIGWNTQANGSGTSYSDEAEYTASAEEHKDITLYAQWAYTTISFNGNTSDSGTMNSVTIAGGTTSNLPASTFIKNNCVFTGWNTESAGTGISYGDSTPYTANATTIEAFTLYAQWQCISQVNYRGNGATSGEMDSSIILGGSTLTFPQNSYTRNNYTFIGWNTVANPTPENPGTSYPDQGSFTAPMTPATTLNLYAQWAATTITFNGNGADGGSMSTATIAAGTSANLPTNGFTKTNCIFTGWNTTSDGSGTSYSNEAEYSAVAGVNASVTLYAQWLYTSTINFNGNGADGGTMNSITAIGGESTTLPQNEYTKTNATFIGWNTQANGTGTPYSDQSEFIASTTQHDEITLYAQWASTTITFNGNGADGGSMSTATIAAGTSANLPQNSFTRTGYIFNGWNTIAGGTGTSYSDQASYYATAGVNTSITLYAQWLPTTTITFNGNGKTSGSMSDQVIVAGTPQNLTPNAYAKDGYVFNGWNTVQTPTAENPGTVYTDKAQYTASTIATENVTLYAQWVVPPTDLTFTAGDHIDTLMVADGSNKYKPFYVTPTSTDRSIVFTAPAEGTKYIITVVPEAGYVLSSDSTNSSYEVAFSTGTLASNTLLTTTYTTGSAGNNITVSAAQAGSDSAHSAYTNMQSLTAAQCPAYADSTQGINVTDSRDNKSYTVAKFGNYCYMLSNLRLDGSVELATDTSHVSSAYTLPADTGSGGWTNDYCKPYMASTNGEYYYNWPAATARTNSTSGTSSCSNDTGNSVGDICPAGWSLPTYQDITPANLWNSGANPGMLSTSGYFNSGSQYNGGLGLWWSSTRYNNYSAFNLYFNGTNADRYSNRKYDGLSVRCMRSS